uniref:anaerobic ribonucleoside-triphosphate reductase n=1 Tax=Clostridium sp. NkU-1 TaxID=1095009 RepID=UPI00326069DA
MVFKKKLLLDGLGGITGKITASPAKHLATLCNQMVNFLGIMQNEWAASQSFSSFDTYLAPFVRADGLAYDKVKKMHGGFCVWSEYSKPLGNPGAIFPYFPGFNGS